MRKRYKNKLRSCKMCKPHKRGWAKRWNDKELQERALAEKEMKQTEFNFK